MQRSIPNQRLLGIQFGRGIAALLVAIYHGCRMMSLPQYAGHTGFGGFFEFGFAGVDFFFVLSGFIIYFVHHSDLNQPKTLLRYGWRRITRIYPDYWLILAVVVALATIKPDGSFSVQHFIRSLFLLPDNREPMLGVAWTLVHEMLFYGVFALGILNLRLGVVVGALWIGFILVGTNNGQVPFNVVGSYLNLQFLMGMVVARFVLTERVPHALWIASAGIVAFLATGLAENAMLIKWASTTSHMLFGICSAVTIAGIAAAERQGKLRVGKVAEFFGGSSYLLYLVHTLAIGFTLQLFKFFSVVHKTPDIVLVTVSVGCSVLLAALLYRYFDLPVQSALNRFGRNRLFPATKQLRERS